ncbi:MAG: hypothetical protein CW341_00845 [Bacteroidetes bacterium]|nr:hypothetical protein [Bacteroidota bacterium]
MKKTNISNELLAKFLDGQTSEEENAQILALLADDKELMEEFTAIAEAAKLADSAPIAPIAEPDLNMAAQQIHESINTQQNTSNSIHIAQRPSHRRFFITLAAAVITILIASTIYLLMRPSNNEDFFVEQKGTDIDTMLTITEQEEILVAENEIPQTTDNIASSDSQNAGTKKEKDTASPSNPSSGNNPNVQMMKQSYASKAEINNLTMLTPPRADYGIQFKNMDKSFKFEWSTGNVQSLNFTLKDSQGRVIANITDPNTNQYELKGNTVYPEKQVTWSIVVRYKDNTEEQRNGKIRIGYEINNQ